MLGRALYALGLGGSSAPSPRSTRWHELALAGRYGWHSVEFGPYFHRVVRSETQWEQVLASMLTRRARSMQADGWQVIGSEFPYTYLKHDLGTPALIDQAVNRQHITDLLSPTKRQGPGHRSWGKRLGG